MKEDDMRTLARILSVIIWIVVVALGWCGRVVLLNQPLNMVDAIMGGSFTLLVSVIPIGVFLLTKE